jgi:hypothetical protein
VIDISWHFSALRKFYHEAMESEMHRYFWLVDHPIALAVVAGAILVVAWPMENVPAIGVAAVMLVAAAGITIRARYLARPA